MQGRNLSKICSGVISFFQKTATSAGKLTKFVKRQSKLTASLFVKTLVLGYQSNPAMTLEKMCSLLKEQHIKISKQGMHGRFNTEAVDLMKHMLGASLKELTIENKAAIDLLKPFSSVHLLDSTHVALPESLKMTCQGYGGDAAGAALKIQVLFNYTKSQLEEAWITEGRSNDQGFKQHLNEVTKEGLYLQDLGYFDVTSFQTLQDKGAYFVSKYLSSTAIFNENRESLCLLSELTAAGERYSKRILLGKKTKLPIRLIAFKLPKEAAEQAVRKIRETAKRQGYTPKPLTLQLARWSILITNVPAHLLHDEQVYLVYSLRWQIELLFKLFKSEAGINKINGKKPNRVLCEIYAKLISIVMLLYICFPIRWKNVQELSLRKAYKQISMEGMAFLKALKSSYRLLQFLERYIDHLSNFALKDKRKKTKLPTYQKLMITTNQEVFA